MYDIMETEQLVDLNTITTYIIRLIFMELIFQCSQQVSLPNWKKRKSITPTTDKFKQLFCQQH